jgi:hypothetical protein
MVKVGGTKEPVFCSSAYAWHNASRKKSFEALVKAGLLVPEAIKKV